MIKAVARSLFGSVNDRVVKAHMRKAAHIGALEPDLEALSDSDIKARTGVLKERAANGESLDDLLVDAFATVREAARRALGQRHFDVQLVGGMVLHEGGIAEMKTGEGKTLVATLPVYLNALAGRGVHVVTVNDYLAQRDAEWMGRVYRFLGLETGCIVAGLDTVERRAAYAADVTYGTNNEFGFDYLRDNMKFSLEERVQREAEFAIVDEVDSILVDEARTPLIISGPTEDNSELYVRVDRLMPDSSRKTTRSTKGAQGDLDGRRRRTAGKITRGRRAAEKPRPLRRAEHRRRPPRQPGAQRPQTVPARRRLHRQGRQGRHHRRIHRAHDGGPALFQRPAPGPRSEGKGEYREREPDPRLDHLPELFRLYPKLAGMTGTAATEAAEFSEIYGLGVVEVPTHMPMIRADNDDEIYRTADEKLEAIVAQIEDCRERGQPVLVGTTSIARSEELAALLKKRKVPHHVLNARYHEQEAFIVAQAGRPGAVTIATNMAGRGTDIQLGGNLEMRLAEELGGIEDAEKRKRVAEKVEHEIAAGHERAIAAGGLYVIGSERHESRRIDNQLRGRSGRQGDPGASKFFLSLEDDLMRIFGSDRMDGMLRRLGLEDGEAIYHPWINRALAKAQEKVEARNFEIRKNLLRFDDVMNDQRKVVYAERVDLMSAADVSDAISDMRAHVVEGLVSRHIPENAFSEQWDTDGLRQEALRVFGLDLPVADWAAEEGIADEEIRSRLADAVDRKMAEKAARVGPETLRRVEKSLMLQLLDRLWKDHLLSLDHLRQGIGLRAFGQRDPLNEYKREAFEMFDAMLERFREAVTATLAHVEVQLQPPAEAPVERGAPAPIGRREPAFASAPAAPRRTVARARGGARDPRRPDGWGKVGRNESCPCGSGRKFKHCHGKVA